MGYKGSVTLEYGSTVLDFGIITSFSESMNKSCMTTPLVSLSVDETCIVESGSSKTYSVSFTRKNPASCNDDSSDSTKWSNAAWYTAIEASVNRWQARTNGFKFRYTPSDDNPYLPSRLENGYVKSMSVKYTSDSNEVLTGSFELHVGTMYVRTSGSVPSDAIYKKNFQMLMSSSDRNRWYILLDDSDDDDDCISCIDSYTLCGGLEQPFEYITVEIPKKRLSSVASALVDDIVAGKNRLVLSAVGKSNMIVTRCKLRNDTYTVTAYCEAESLKGYKTTKSGSMSPLSWIKEILTTGQYGVTFHEGDSFVYAINDISSDVLSFGKGTNVWYILQVCAMYLGARIFFAENKAFLVDYRQLSPRESAGVAYQNYGETLDLYADDESPFVVGSVSLGDEGTDTITNSQTIKCSDTFGTYQNNKEVVVNDKISIKAFNEREGSVLYMPNLVEGGDYKQATTFGENLISYRNEPQQSISFKVKEMSDSNNGAYWSPRFFVSSKIMGIKDEANDVLITNESDLEEGVKHQKLTLSTFERSYPEGVTEYTWGVMASIDLSTSTSQILSNQGSIL